MLIDDFIKKYKPGSEYQIKEMLDDFLLQNNEYIVDLFLIFKGKIFHLCKALIPFISEEMKTSLRFDNDIKSKYSFTVYSPIKSDGFYCSDFTDLAKNIVKIDSIEIKQGHIIIKSI